MGLSEKSGSPFCVLKKVTEVVLERVLFGSDYSGCSQMTHVEFVRKLELSEEVEKKFYMKTRFKFTQ